MYSVLKRTLTQDELLLNQQTGNQNISDDVYSSSRYANRWEMCDQLFSKWTDEELAQAEREVLSYNGQSKFYFVNDDQSGNINFDVYPVPLNLDVNDRTEYKFPNRTIHDVMNYPYISRTKFILKERHVTEYFTGRLPKDSVIEYFMNMYMDYVPVLDYYKNTFFSHRPTFYALNVIKYAVPFATDEDVRLQRIANSTLWGVAHYDQNLAGLHLGESHTEFQLYNSIADEWEEVPFDDGNKTLFMWGDPAVTKINWNGSKHRMNGPFYKTDKDKCRYSIIFDIVPTDDR